MKWRTLATVLFAAVGVYAIVEAICAVRPLVRMVNTLIWRYERPVSEIVMTVGLELVGPVLLFSVGLYLLFRPPLGFLDKRIPDDETLNDGRQRVVLLRMSMMVVGVWLICRAVLHGSQFLFALAFWANPHEWIQWEDIMPPVLCFFIGVYLLFGAPHLVRWMARRLERYDQTDDDDDDKPQSRPRVTT